MLRPLSAEPPQDHKRIRERFDCDMLCRAAGALDHVANHEPSEDTWSPPARGWLARKDSP